MMWSGGSNWWMAGAIVVIACMFLMGWMMMGHGRHDHGSPDQGRASADDILAERFARGEISEAEFEERKRVLTPNK